MSNQKCIFTLKWRDCIATRHDRFSFLFDQHGLVSEPTNNKSDMHAVPFKTKSETSIMTTTATATKATTITATTTTTTTTTTNTPPGPLENHWRSVISKPHMPHLFATNHVGYSWASTEKLHSPWLVATKEHDALKCFAGLCFCSNQIVRPKTWCKNETWGSEALCRLQLGEDQLYGPRLVTKNETWCSIMFCWLFVLDQINCTAQDLIE